MKSRGPIVLVVLALLAGAIWWWLKHRDSDTAATSSVTQPAGSGAPIDKSAPGVKPSQPARLAIAVSDDHGPLAGAVVRLAPSDGDIVVVKTGADGVAHADQLEPGTWAISASALDHAPAALARHELAAGADDRVALVLAPGGRTLSGVVSDATTGPIEGARVDAAKLGGMITPTDAVATTLTGPDGKYRLTVAEGQLLVAASSPDYAPQSRYVEVGAAGATADFALVPGGKIEGIVRDERTKQPVGGARVTARRDSPRVLLAETGMRHVIARADGHFKLTGLAPGAWELAATAAERHTKAPTVVGIGVAEQVGDVELLVGTGPVLRGRVVDEDGKPAPGVDVSANTEGEGVAETADARGNFVIAGLRPGHYMLRALGGDFVPAGMAQVDLADKDVDNITITVRHGALIKGHVERRQICEIHHEIDDGALGADMPMMLAPTTSDENGDFTLGPASPGKAKLFARCGSGDQGSLAIEVKPGMAEVVIKVSPGGSIAGRVLDGDGKPVGGVTVMADLQTTGERTTIVNGMITSGTQALTSATGGYELRALGAGTYHLRVLDRGKPPLRPRTAPSKVELAAAEKKTGVDLAIDRPNGVIKGTVTGPDGKPLADAWVSVHQDLASMIEGMRGDDTADSRMVTVQAEGEGGPAGGGDLPPALTDAAGHYEIRGLTHARYDVVAEAQKGELRARKPDVTPDATVDLQALGVTTLSGTVHGPSGPTKLFSVELEGPTRASRSFADGTFSFGRVDPGMYTIRVESSEGNAETKLEVKQNQPATVDIALVANAIVVGKLVDGAGKPVSGLGIVLVPDLGDGHVQVQLEGPPPQSGPDGSFRIEHRAEKSALVVMSPPRPVTKKGLDLQPGKTLDLGSIVVAASP